MNYDIAIVGAGIVGCATALKIQAKNPELSIVIIDKEKEVSVHQTGNNSGVIHSGIYYKPGSLKAINCKKGYDMLLEFLKKHSIPFELCGKIIVATHSQEIERLTAIYERGIQNGLTDLRYINEQEIKEIEPNIAGVKGIVVPQTGIVDYKVVCEKYMEIFLKNGGIFLKNCAALDLKEHENTAILSTQKGTIIANKVINCAGLFCDKVAAWVHKDLDIRIIPFRGEYYQLKKENRHLINNLVYPVPDPAFPFLGVHFTRRITGEIEAGPNAVFAFKKEGYKRTDFSVSETMHSLKWKGFRKVARKYWKTGMGEFYRSFSKKAFTKALRKLMPTITLDDLEPGGAGIRAQACTKDGKLIDDFYIRQSKHCIHVLNAPSPAATSSLAIGEAVSEMVSLPID